MPNHVQHNLTFIGPAAKVTELLNHIKGEDGHLFDFNTIDPMPEELQNTTSPSPPNHELIAKYGASDWYSWKCKNWGTKWGAYDTAITSDGVLQFQTAWSTPEPIFAKLSTLFPEVRLVIDYADEDIGNNVGHLEYIGGELVEETVGDVEDACRIWEYDYEEHLAEQAEWERQDLEYEEMPLD